MEQTLPSEGDEAVADAVTLSAYEQFLRLLDSGGPVLYLLCALSVVAVTVILYKLIQFARLRGGRQGFVDQALALWGAGQPEQSLALLERERSPLARVLAVALRGRAAPGLSESVVREEVTRIAALELDRMRGGLGLLSSIATLSPLIGLLGTVLGMIDAFQALEAAGSRVDPSILSGGIWVALLTTAGGLLIAIPAAAAHNGLQAALTRLRRAMEDAVTRVFTLTAEPGESAEPAASPARSG